MSKNISGSAALAFFGFQKIERFPTFVLQVLLFDGQERQYRAKSIDVNFYRFIKRFEFRGLFMNVSCRQPRQKIGPARLG
jgi:hypothetical protein